MSYFVLSVDTEADNAWAQPEKIKLKNFNGIPKFQKLCEEYNIIPTYLLTYEYAIHQPAIDFIKEKLSEGKCEVGYHLHVWTTPPFCEEKNGIDLAWIHAYQYELPDELFYLKANSLYKAISESFQILPTSHRAGRWGIDERTIDWLDSKNFKIDSSIVPYINYSRNIGKKLSGPNFTYSYTDVHLWQTKNSNTLIELPVSTYNKLPLLNKYLSTVDIDILHKFRHKLLPTIILRPNPFRKSEDYINLLRSNKMYLNCMLHSSELTYGTSPFTNSIHNCNKIWYQLEYFFNSVCEQNIQSLAMSKVRI